MTEKKTIETDEKKLTVNNFISFGDDPQYFAVCGKDLYRKIEDGKYALMEKDFKKRICDT